MRLTQYIKDLYGKYNPSIRFQIPVQMGIIFSDIEKIEAITLVFD